MELLFLGTSSMVPTKDRNQQSLLVGCNSYDVLIDCGEATQRQFKIKKITPNRIRKILLSHWHGDHVLGLPGLLMTLGMNSYDKTLEIYGPEGTKEAIKQLAKIYHFRLSYPLKIKEVKTGKIFEDDNIIIECTQLDHNPVCFGYSIKEKDRRRMKLSLIKKLGIPEGPLLGKLQRGSSITWKGKRISSKDATYVVKGKKLACVMDTEICDNAIKLARDADVLVCEATLKSDLDEVAYDRKHLTAKLAGDIANQANAKQLIITHFSQRYKSTTEMEEDAKSVFHNTRAAFDFMKIKL